MNVYSGRCVEDEIRKIHTTLSNSAADWKARIEALSMLRSLILAGASSYDEFTQPLKEQFLHFFVSFFCGRGLIIFFLRLGGSVGHEQNSHIIA